MATLQGRMDCVIVTELCRTLEAESTTVYALYREKAIELVALAGELDALKREANSAKSCLGDYTRENGLPGINVNMRYGFEPGAPAWWDQYGPETAMGRFLSWLERNEELLGW